MKKKIRILLLCILIFLMMFQSAFAAELPDISNFDGKRIAVQSSTTFVTLVDSIFKDVEVFYFETIPDCVAALKQGKVDAVIGDEPALRYCAAQVDGVTCIPYGEATDQIASISAKTERGTMLINQFNDYFRKLKKSGEAEKLLTKWLDGPASEQFTEDYSNLPDINGTIIIATSPTFPPLQFINNGKITGYETELWINFCKEYGYKPQFENVTFGGIIAGVTLGKYDIGQSGFSITEERKQKVLFSDIILNSGTGIVYATDEEKNSAFDGFYSTFVQDNRWRSFLSGIFVTTRITVFSVLLGTAFGFCLYLFIRKGNKKLIFISEALKRFVIGMPVVVWLMMLYYIIFGKTSLSGEIVSIIGFSIIFGFTFSSMLSMGENSIDKGQALAADAMGYSKNKTFFRIILPQAIQVILPSYKDEVISHLKATAIVGYIAVVDVTKVGDLVRGMTYDAFFPLISVALSYFILSGILRFIISKVCKKTDPRLRSKEDILKGAVLK